MAEHLESTAARSRRWRWPLRSLLGLAVLAGLALAGAALWLDSDAGHRFIIGQVEALAPETGLRIRVGEIDGSIYSEAEV